MPLNLTCGVCGKPIEGFRRSKRYCEDCKAQAGWLQKIVDGLNDLAEEDPMMMEELLGKQAEVSTALRRAYAPLLDGVANMGLLGLLNCILNKDFGLVSYDGTRFAIEQRTFSSVWNGSLTSSVNRASTALQRLGSAIDVSNLPRHPQRGGVHTTGPIFVTGTLITGPTRRPRVVERPPLPEGVRAPRQPRRGEIIIVDETVPEVVGPMDTITYAQAVNTQFPVTEPDNGARQEAIVRDENYENETMRQRARRGHRNSQG